MIDTPQALAAAVANFLTLDAPPSEAAIDEVLNRFAPIVGDEEKVREARRLLHARFAIRMEMGETLKGDDEHQPCSTRAAARSIPSIGRDTGRCSCGLAGPR